MIVIYPFMNNDIISDSSLDGYPGNEALYNYLPVVIAKGVWPLIKLQPMEIFLPITWHYRWKLNITNLKGVRAYSS